MVLGVHYRPLEGFGLNHSVVLFDPLGLAQHDGSSGGMNVGGRQGQSSGHKTFFFFGLPSFGNLYADKVGNFEEAKKYYLMAIDDGQGSGTVVGNSNAMASLGLLYRGLDDTENAKKYYLMAIDRENSGAMFGLGYLYAKFFV